MKQILKFIFVASTCAFITSTAAAIMKKPKSVTLDIKINEEKNPFDKLKIKFVRFDHEHSSSGPGQPFSANTGVYFLQVTDGASTTDTMFYTNINGLSNSTPVLDKYEIQILKATGDQKKITLKVKKTN